MNKLKFELNDKNITPFLSLNINKRLIQAYDHAYQYNQLNESIFPYHDFSLSMKELFDIALGKQVLPSYKNKVEKCFEYMLFHKTGNTTYWSHQSFSFTLYELLEECMKQLSPHEIKNYKNDMFNFHQEYIKMIDDFKQKNI